MWYYEERTALGRWSPRTEPSQPSAVTASGTKRHIRAVREVPLNMTGYDLNVLRDWSDAVIAKEAAEAAAKTTPEVRVETLPEVPVGWEVIADWSELPDVYVTSVRRMQGMFWEITAASVPMATVPEVRLVRADDRGWAVAIVPPLPRLQVKPLSWREIDPGFRFVGTGLGFTCEVRRTFMGVWEAVFDRGRLDFRTREEAMDALQETYAVMVLSYVEVLP